MESKTALKTILVISVLGILFSGYLSYFELAKQVCVFGGCTSVAGVPACFYGFVMYSIIFVISLLGLESRK